MDTLKENGPARHLAAAGLLTLTIAVIYSNSLTVPFLLDDQINVLYNSSIKSFHPFWRIFFAEPGVGMAGRPLANATLALNWAVSGQDVWSYHLVNILIHAGAAFTLFAFLYHALRTPVLRGSFGGHAFPLALSCSLLWAAHPLNTESVTYISQRAESLMGLFFLLTLLTAAKGFDSPKKIAWHGFSVLFFIMGVYSKEVIVAAPVCVLCYDVVFSESSIKRVLRRSYDLYTGYAAGVMLLVILVVSGKTSAAGPISKTATPLEYAVSQLSSIVHYLGLSFWPHPLNFDYSPGLVDFPLPVWLCGIIVFTLAAATLALLHKKKPAAMPGIFFFTILAPTSSILPMGYAVLEHRMYLPLAAVIATVVLCAHSLSRRAGGKLRPGLLPVGAVLLAVAFLSLGAATFARNRDYSSAVALWTDTLKKSPGNWRAHHAMGQALSAQGRTEEAVAWHKKAIAINPGYAGAYNDLGVIYFQMGRISEAIPYFREAAIKNPGSARAFLNLGAAVASLGKRRDAVIYFEKAFELNPKSAQLARNLGILYSEEGKPAAAVKFFEKALNFEPDYRGLHFLLGKSLLEAGRPADAKIHLSQAVAENPADPEARELLEKASKQK